MTADCLQVQGRCQDRHLSPEDNDSCPMDGFDFDAVGKLINLPDDHVVAMFVAIGKAIKEAWPRPGQLTMSEVVVENRF